MRFVKFLVSHSERIAHIGVYGALGCGQHELYEHLGMLLCIVLVLEILLHVQGE